MTGSKIFADNGEGDKSESGISDGNVNNRTSVRMVQQAANGISQISFSTEDKVSPRNHQLSLRSQNNVS
ncbi:UNVERIFIED_CONTAM: hypothetical protein Slati_0017400 [Sesamum latifolium]|uniref:DUF4057 domain-containing protein n=1 Tax=Sesamum latifolium TaxID=2727402 RepID=A0AAW2Y663_9LAMI